ncbi:MAG: glycosyltransferase [Gammaproteobacteria bacterium]|nr:glycosyltransferase [Gammaproteobacteria bacterium]
MNDVKIKILHVTFNMGIGGTEQVIRQIIENSDVDRFTHEILCIDGEIGPLGLALQEKGIHIENIQRQPGIDIKLLKFMRQLLKKRKINVMHCHQYTPYFYGVLSASFTKTKVIFTEHGRFYPDIHNAKRRIINPLLLLATDHVTAISKSTADAVAKYEYIQCKKVKVIYNGISDLKEHNVNKHELLKALNLSNGFRYIGTISRLEPIKNQSMMIDAFYRVKQQITDIKLIIIGDGALMADLKQHAEAMEIADDIVFTGFIDNPQKYINLFEIFLLSSFSEGASMTLLEAMSLSKPCIVTNVGGNPEVVVDNKTGFISPSNDVEKFASAIIDLLENKNIRAELGNSGRERYLKHFSVRQMADKYESLYLEAIV